MGTAATAQGTVELVLGTAQLRTPYGVLRQNDAAPDARQAHALLTTAAALEVEALDTAPAYGRAEETIGEVAGAMRVHTKIDPTLTPHASLAGSLARLRRDHVELLYLHDAAEVLCPESPVLTAAFQLVGRGVGTLGASVYEVAEFDAAVADARFGAVQVPLNVFDRRLDEKRLTEAAARGVHVYARSVLLQGVLTAPPARVTGPVGGLRPYIEGLDRLANRLGRSTIELALGWVRALPGVRGVVVGAESVEELHGLVSAFRSDPLTPGEMDELRSLDLPAPELCDPRRW